jgi:hypothetical protein
MSDFKDIPPIPDSVDGALARPLRAMREVIQRLIGTRGNDPAITAGNAGSLLSGGNTIVFSGGGGSGSTYVPDLTPPPTVSTLAVSAGISQIIVTWDGITYTQGHGNKQTIIYAVKKDPSDATYPTFPGDAGIVATAPHPLVIISIPSEPNTRWHVWAKFESVDGVKSTSEAGGTNGVIATTGQDVAKLLAVLTNQIRASQLYTDLSLPIGTLPQRQEDAALDALQNTLLTHQANQQHALDLLNEANDRGTAISQETNLRTSGDSQLAQSITTLTAKVNTDVATVLASVQTEAIARADADSAEASLRLSLASQVNDATTGLPATRSTLLTNYSTTSSMNAAIASASTILQTDYIGRDGIISSAVSTEAITRTSETGYLGSQYTVRVSTTAAGRTVVGGFGISNTTSGTAGSTVDFGVRADKFWIGATNDGTAAGVTDVLPFIVQTADTTINGQFVPKGVYMDTVFIRDGTITNVKIADATIDSAKIASLAADKIISGSIGVGLYIQSTGYVSSSSGWRISGDGTAEFSGVIVRGTIYASAGTIGGISIGSTYIRSTGFSSGTAGFALNSDGTGQIGGVTFTTSAVQSANFVDGSTGFKLGYDGVLKAYSGQFSGKVSVGSSPVVSGSTMTGVGVVLNQSGTFAAGTSTKNLSFDGSTLTINGDLVATGNIVTEAVTIPRFTFAAGRTATVTITIPVGSGGATVLITGSVNVPNGGWTQRVKVDGVDVRTESCAAGTIPALIWSTSLTSGAHTVTITNDDPSGANAFAYVIYTMR